MLDNRLAIYADLDDIMKLVEQAQAFMKSNGLDQCGTVYLDGSENPRLYRQTYEKIVNASCRALAKHSAEGE